MLLYDFAVQTLVQTLFDLGADYVATYDSYGNIYMSPNANDQWVNDRTQHALESLIATRPLVGARRNVLALSLSPRRMARLILSAVPGGYVVAVLGGFESWVSVGLARSLADAIENWSTQRQTRRASRFW
jgi:hypothetical protein